MEGRQLLPQRQVFQDQFTMAAERQRERADDYDEQRQHAVIGGWSCREIQLRTSSGEGQHAWKV